MNRIYNFEPLIEVLLIVGALLVFAAFTGPKESQNIIDKASFTRTI